MVTVVVAGPLADSRLPLWQSLQTRTRMGKMKSRGHKLGMFIEIC